MSEKTCLQDKKIELIGCGDIGCRLAILMTDAGADVTAYRRSVDKLPQGIKARTLDVTDIGSLQSMTDEEFHYIVVTLSPSAMSDESYKATYVDGLKNLLDVLKTQTLRKLLWICPHGEYRHAMS